MTTTLAALLSVIASGAGQLLLRRGAMAASPTAADPRALAALLLNPYVVGGVMAWGVATLLWVVVLSRAPLTHVYALGSLNYVAVPLLSSALLGEPLGRAQLPGMALVAAGVALTLAGRAAP